MFVRWPDGPVTPCHGLGQGARSDAEGALDDPSLADNATLEGEHLGLAFAQRAHHLETLDRGVGRLQRLDSAHWPDQLLEFAVVGLDDVVEVFDLPVPRVHRALALRALSCAMAAA